MTPTSTTSPRPCASTAPPPTRCWSARSTFESFRAFWPQQTDDETGVREHLNRVHKYVVSSTLTDPGWEPATVLGLDDIEAVKATEGGDMVCTGSLTLVPELIARGLVDEFRLFVYPVVLGSGQRLFERPLDVELAETSEFRSGIVLLRYRASSTSATMAPPGVCVVAASSIQRSSSPPSSITVARKLRRTAFGRRRSHLRCGSLSRLARVRATRSGPLRTVRAPGGSSTCLVCDGMDVLGACPLDCPDGCSWVVTVEDGQAVRLRGNREHPFTAGALCAKVNGYLEHTRAPDRLLYPLRRVGAKGSGEFERISWDEALAEIAAKLHAVRDEFGGEAIWPFQGTGTLGYLQGLKGRAGQRLWNVLGASRHDMTICSVAGRVGAAYVTGTAAGMDPETFAHSKLILLWGTNTLTSGHHLWKFILAARKNGAHIVAIDPLRTRTAAQADEHLAPLPGTDAALALGLLHVIVSMDAQDDAYLAAHTVGWEAFRERILEFPPSRVASITGLDEDVIVALGRRIATTRPTGIRCTMGMQRHAGGGNALRLLYALPGVTGDWQYPGGGASYSTSGRFVADVDGYVRDDLLRSPVRTLSMTRLGEALLSLDDPAGQGARRLRRQPDELQPRPGAGACRVCRARTCSRS